jgi:(1->4)-alpha-D-glucan 1-alpha-D-glucosylmutase
LEEEGIDSAFAERIREHMRKAVNEAKRNTSWLYPNTEYLEACDRFVDRLLGPEGHAFRASFVPRAKRVARLGLTNSLVQVVLKATVPGVPDFYQGNEIWDFSLVDPDNRRAVDYGQRQGLLKAAREADPASLLRDWRSGAIKLRVTQALLQLRQRRASLFRSADYRPLTAVGTYTEHVVAFVRSDSGAGAAVTVIVPRLSAGIGSPPLGANWDDTAIELPGPRAWRDAATGRCLERRAGPVPLRELFSVLPFAVLESTETT